LRDRKATLNVNEVTGLAQKPHLKNQHYPKIRQ
jgi:hypothetical protein